VDELLAFWRARLDETEVAAKAWLPFGNPDAGQRDHFARHDPGRALREVAADRAILARYEDCLARMEDPEYPAGVARDQAREYEDFVIPNRVAVHSDHPDYRAEEWKP
jgi:hypothetical protein